MRYEGISRGKKLSIVITEVGSGYYAHVTGESFEQWFPPEAAYGVLDNIYRNIENLLNVIEISGIEVQPASGEW